MATRQVVVGYDASRSSRLALSWAARESQARGLPLLVAHAGYTATPAIAGFVTMVTPGPEVLMAAAEGVISQAVEQVHREFPDLDVRTAVVPGPPALVLLDLLSDAALCVVGTRGRGTFKELLVGSTSLHLATHAPCPVVVVRAGGHVEAGPEPGHVVVGVDGSADATAAVGFAFEEASFRGCGLTGLLAWQVPHAESDGWLTDADLLSAAEDEATRVLSESLAGWAEQYPDVHVVRNVVRGEAVSELVAASAGAQLVVVGSRGLGGFRSLLLGSVGHGVLHHARSAVVIVRPPIS